TVHKHMKFFKTSTCGCYRTPIFNLGFWQECALTSAFIEESLVPFLRDKKIEQLDLTACQADKDELIPLLRHCYQLSINKLLLPRMLTKPEITAYVQQDSNKMLRVLEQALRIVQNPYAVTEECQSLSKDLFDEHKIGPNAKHPHTLMLVVPTDLSASW